MPDSPRSPSADVVARWLAGFAGRTSGELPPHHPECLGCGPDNPHGHHLQVVRDGDAVRTSCVFDQRHVGAPGIAHGGAVATVVDDLLGFLLFVVGEPGVTRHLEVGYRKPVLLGQRYDGQALLDRREGRKLFCTATLTDPGGGVAVQAKALFGRNAVGLRRADLRDQVHDARANRILAGGTDRRSGHSLIGVA